jgi:hypothetical protein
MHLGQPLQIALWNDAAMRLELPRRASIRVPDAVLVASIAALLAAAPALLAMARGDGAPVGADTPVYVWWAKLVGAAGSSSVAMRPGVPNVVELVAAALGTPEAVAVAALGCSLVAMLGLVGSAVLRAGGEPSRTAVVGLVLTGCFGVYLATGHLSNAVFATLFVLALAFMLDGGIGRVAMAAGLLGAAGLAHPDFSWLSCGILIGAAALALVAGRRREAMITTTVALAGTGVSIVGLLGASSGGSPFDVPTSLDVFLLQAGLMSRLHVLFLERFRPKVSSYALWVWIPLASAALGRRRWGAPLRRLLVAWVAVSIAGAVVGLVWRPFPPHRIVAFAYCLPLLAATGLTVVIDRVPRFGRTIALGVVAAAVVTSARIWIDAPRPFADPTAAGAQAVAPQIANTHGPVIVDLPSGANATAVAVIRATNLVRAAAAPDRIRDVIVRFPEPDPADGDNDALWKDTEAHIAAARKTQPVSEIAMPLSTTGAAPTPVVELIGAIVGWLATCGIAGCGWCIAAGQRGSHLVERSVGVGLAALILAASVADVLGFRLGQRAVALGVVGIVTAMGALAAIVATLRKGSGLRTGTSTTAGVGGRVLPLDRSGTG